MPLSVRNRSSTSDSCSMVGTRNSASRSQRPLVSCRPATLGSPISRFTILRVSWPSTAMLIQATMSSVSTSGRSRTV
ncbi:hypothetical protein G6F64_015646 [Rhizopus arrhizus]|uniref:Uncharacterized protein n=1 Tax=Rhizopus oryzae TaxID=64495 RepID=A0A9P7BI42_RHIOR|nr:hypothetical protein G6F64_015646 [Rhizopus arrhizus]